MQKTFAKIAAWLSAHKELARANSYIKYLERENEHQLSVALDSMCEVARRDIEIRRLESDLRRESAIGVAEGRFLAVCRDIYRNGKMISEMRFRGMVNAIINEGTPNSRKGKGVNNDRTITRIN